MNGSHGPKKVLVGGLLTVEYELGLPTHMARSGQAVVCLLQTLVIPNIRCSPKNE